MVAIDESTEKTEPPDTPARYWSGYDALDEKIARINVQLVERTGKNFRDGWWRYNTRNKVLGPLESAARFRRADTHALIRSRHASGSPTEEHHCSCGLIIDMPLLPVPESKTERDEREAGFLAAPGHIDWRTRDLENDPAPEPEPATPPKPPRPAPL
jgi:hypothetical protein